MAVKKQDRLRQELAQEAARIIVSEGVHDYQKAKCKARERLHALQGVALPSNVEIESAIRSFARTFLPDHERVLRSMRCTALTVMNWLAPYRPYLTGPVLEGTAGAKTPISLHVSCDCTEEVLALLQRRGMAVRLADRQFRQNRPYTSLPVLVFTYREHEIDVTVFSLRQQHQPPKSRTHHRSVQRINGKALTSLLGQGRSEAVRGCGAGGAPEPGIAPPRMRDRDKPRR